MEINKLAAAIYSFIDVEFMPKATTTEKMVIVGASVLGAFDLESVLGMALNSKFIANSKIWEDDTKEKINLSVLEELFTKFLNTMGDRYVYEGYTQDFGFKTVNLFEGYVIDQDLVGRFFTFLRNR